MASLAFLIDTFPGPGISALWVNSYGASISVVGGLLQFVTTSTGANFYGLTAATTYDLTNSSMAVQVVNAGNQNLASLVVYPIYLDKDGTNQNLLYFTITEGTLSAYKRVSGVDSNLFSTSYDPVAHQWLRIREAAGSVYWESAPDGLTWTAMFSLADPFAPITAVLPSIVAGTYNIEATPTTVQFDNVNATSSLGGFTTGHSVVIATPTVIPIRQFPGRSSGRGIVRGAISVNIARPLAGRSTGNSSVRAAASALVNFYRGQSQGHARVWARMPVSLPAQTAGHAKVIAHLNITNALPGRSEGHALVRGTLHVTVHVHGPVGGHAMVRGRVMAIRPIHGSMAGHGKAWATLHSIPTRNLKGTTAGHTMVRGHLVDPRRLLSASAQGHAIVTGKLQVTVNFIGWGTPIQA